MKEPTFWETTRRHWLQIVLPTVIALTVSVVATIIAAHEYHKLRTNNYESDARSCHNL